MPLNDDQAESLKSHVIIAAMLAGSVVLAFSPALYADFVAADDPQTVTENPMVRAINADTVRAMFTTFTLGHYQPLALLSLAIDHAFWGMNPRGFHLTNIALHAVNTVLVYAVALKVLTLAFAREDRLATVPAPASTEPLNAGSPLVRWAACFAAAFYALHPLRVESVAWVTERRDVLSLMFLLAATLAYLAYVQGRRGWYVACLALLALSLLSKAWGMSFFVVLLLLDVYPLRRLPANPMQWRRYGRVLIEKVPFAAMGLAAAVVASFAQQSATATKSLEEWGIVPRLVQAVYGLWFYVWKTAVPAKLAAFYEIPNHFNPLEPRFVVAYLAVAVIGVALLLRARQRPGIVAALAAFTVLVAPVLGVLQSGDQLVADRYATIAGVPLSLLVGALTLGWARKLSPGGRQTLAAGATPLILLLSYLTWKQADTWHDTETLWRQAVNVTDGTTVCEFLGRELEQDGKGDEAALAFKEALRRDPSNGQAMYLLANLTAKAGRVREAEPLYREAVKIMRQPYMGHVTLALLYANALNEPAKAEASFKAALDSVVASPKVKPSERGIVELPYGMFLKQQGRTDEARGMLNRALEDPETRELAQRELDTLTQR